VSDHWERTRRLGRLEAPTQCCEVPDTLGEFYERPQRQHPVERLNSLGVTQASVSNDDTTRRESRERPDQSSTPRDRTRRESRE